ncbi:MAG TPA: hypothetical protein VFA57_20180 [Pseudolabrys sp.]|jgi:hypothetical protein|nr:hypothetical protein [Pseudolabrys sp.]
MRKLVVLLVALAGLLTAAALLPAAPAKAEAMIGCVCARLNAAAVCTPTPEHCTAKHGGVCVLPCSYEAPKKVAKRHHHKKQKAM